MSIWAPWASIGRARLRLDHITGALRQYPSFYVHTNAPGWDGIKQHKYPSKKADSAVFEAKLSEYTKLGKASKTVEPPSSTVEVLIQCIRQGEFDTAERIRSELVQMGVEIPLDPIYEKAAAEVLGWPNPANHIEAFSSWLALLPTADASTTHGFPDLERSLLSSPAPHQLPLIVAFARACYSKGYEGLVRTSVVPTVKSLATPGDYRKFLKETVTLGKKGKKVRRDLIHDGAQSLDRAKQGPLVDLNNVENSDASVSMHTAITPSLDPPSTQESDSIFEDLTFEYSADNHGDVLTDNTPTDICQALVDLVQSQKYEEADHLLAEMTAFGISIPPSFVYEKAAEAALRSPQTSEERLDQFTKWFSMIPDARMAGRRKFYSMRRFFFLSRVTNLSLIARFGVICASKGFAHDVYWFVFAPLMRYADEQVSAQFLKDFEDAHQAYLVRDSPSDAVAEMRRARRSFRTVAIKGLAASGREVFAVQLLPTEEAIASGDALPLPVEVFTLLVSRIRQLPSMDVTIKRALLDRVNQSFKSVLDADYSQYEYAGIPAVPSPRGDEDSESIVERLLFLKNTIATGEQLRTKYVVRTMSLYLSTGRTKAITLLRVKALRSNPSIALEFIFAEMMYYRSQRLFELVIVTFYQHFYLTGVPRDEILVRLRAWNVLEGGEGIKEQWDDKYAKHGKLWPTPYHCSLVWHALVGLNETREGLEALYVKFCQYAEGHSAEDPAQLESLGVTEPPLPPPPSWKHRVDDSSFVPFIRALNVRFGPTRGAKVLSDMMKLGIPPTIYVFTELAGRYAKLGDVTRAFLILDRLEAANMMKPASTPDEMKSALASADAQDDSEATENAPAPAQSSIDFPAPNIVLLTSMLRGFVDSKSLDGASRLVERIHSKLSEEDVMDDQLQAALSTYEELQSHAEIQRANPGVRDDLFHLKIMRKCSLTGTLHMN
ncbi:hypothetical protein PLEOSDRAFT_1081317 [Pleurotus ostreatus PC15]|uniref:Pentacotripeptide-repeat region of PRORP domain-containing protein n=1 Tax=Pleurotus ostreatus (strain PC15) TaxID=1137138 RepID=A0A067NY90_PLEO1|nr:hypothetical protein PLEOSDRAFT_1081317 [Pleurotus ostreatus PC15]